MNAQENALAGVARVCDRLSLPYMVIGGMANAVWGVPRATLDVDVSVWVESSEISERIDALGQAFTILVPDPEAFVRETHVLPLKDARGVRIDVIFAMLPYEQQAIRRAVQRDVLDTKVSFCTAEDLVLHKIISDRPRDIDDVRQVLARQSATIDRSYLDPRVKELADVLEQPEIWHRYQSNLAAPQPP
jgi:hypothetical protein